MARKTEAYVDTSAFISLLDRSDTHHDRFARLFSDPPRLLTTTLVIAEGHGWFLRRYDPARALQFLAMVEEMTPLSLLSVGQEEQHAAVRILRRFSDQRLTLVDALGLHVMTARKIHSCWSTDRHLGLMGAGVVIHES